MRRRMEWGEGQGGRSREAHCGCVRSLTDVRVIGKTDALDGQDVVPGFSCPLKDVLGRSEASSAVPGDS
jgi:hypothetical protein